MAVNDVILARLTRSALSRRASYVVVRWPIRDYSEVRYHKSATAAQRSAGASGTIYSVTSDGLVPWTR